MNDLHKGRIGRAFFGSNGFDSDLDRNINDRHYSPRGCRRKGFACTERLTAQGALEPKLDDPLGFESITDKRRVIRLCTLVEFL